jgi:hypothetical protein
VNEIFFDGEFGWSAGFNFLFVPPLDPDWLPVIDHPPSIVSLVSSQASLNFQWLLVTSLRPGCQRINFPSVPSHWRPVEPCGIWNLLCGTIELRYWAAYGILRIGGFRH